jgi:hypothetical protein
MANERDVTPTPEEQELALLTEEYHYLAACMQTGVKFKDEFSKKRGRKNNELEPKHLRVGLNSNAVEHSALADLLIQKGIITKVEYFRALVKAMARERESYTKDVKDISGMPNIILGPAGGF